VVGFAGCLVSQCKEQCVLRYALQGCCVSQLESHQGCYVSQGGCVSQSCKSNVCCAVLCLDMVLWFCPLARAGPHRGVEGGGATGWLGGVEQIIRLAMRQKQGGTRGGRELLLDSCKRGPVRGLFV
jgi:hypothetical protein